MVSTNSAASWDLRVTRDSVTSLFGADQRALLEPVLEALRDRQRFARLHYQCASRALHEFLPAQLSLSEVIARTVPWDAEQRGALDDCLTVVEANVLACVQSLHAQLDNLAHVVYFGTGMDRHADFRLPNRAITLNKVRSAVARLEGARRVADSLSAFRDGSVYLSALVNHGKHRSLVPLMLHVDPPIPGRKSAPNYRLEFGSFNYDNKPFAARAVLDFLEQDYLRLSAQVVETGCALNKWLLEQIRFSSACTRPPHD
jgi:hypothetical protein